MLESYLIEEIKEVKKLQAMNHDMLDFLRTAGSMAIYGIL